MRRRSSEVHGLRGALAVLAPASLMAAGRTDFDAALPGIAGALTRSLAPPVADLLAAPLASAMYAAHFAAAVTMLFGALLLPGRPATGRALATTGLVSAALLAVAGRPKEPALGFLVLLAIGALLARIWPAGRDAREAPHGEDDVAPLARASARGAAWASLATWIAVGPAGWGAGDAAYAATAVGVTALFAGRWMWIARRFGAAGTPMVATAAGAGGFGALLLPVTPAAGLLLALAAPLLTLRGTHCAAAPALPTRGISLWDALVTHPARALVATFAALCTLGAVVLALPFAATRPVSFVDALFTAVSATCVTGLAVLDTPVDLTFAGQFVVLLLIQVGGLGILTFSTATAALLGQRLSVRAEGAMAGMLGADGAGDVFRSVRQVLVVTFAAEGLGAAALTALFALAGDPLPTALWRGVFTAVSAYCNAGFALQSASLVPYAASPLVLHVVGALILVGSLGPAVVVGLPALVRGGRAPLQARLAVATSALLLVLPAIAFGALEWTNTLGDLAFSDRLHNAWFQSVTLRTAGFNSVDLAEIHPATRTLLLLCMFVGGSPGSTAGGIKTTTAALLTLAVVAAIRGRTDATAFGRRIAHASVYRAAAIATMGVASVGAGLAALQLTQDLPDHLLVFEIVSALGTVGLTLGATPQLDDVGRIIVAVAMFMGRVGPLTLFLLLTERETFRGAAFPEEGVAVG